MFSRSLALTLTLLGFAASPIAQGNALPQITPEVIPVVEAIKISQNTSEEPIQLASDASNFIGGAIVGGLLGHAVSRDRRGYYEEPAPRRHRRGRGRGYRAAKRDCADRYRSYDWGSDTFVTYGGVEKLCPYVRPYY